MVLHWRMERADRVDLTVAGAGGRPSARRDLEKELRTPVVDVRHVHALLASTGMGGVSIG